MNIHPSSVVHEKAILGKDVKIGPFCVVGENVTLGDGTELISHVSIVGHTTIGKRNVFSPFCSIGQLPQDLKYRGEETFVKIGDDNVFKEYVTVNLGTIANKVTEIGNKNFIMVSTHIAHDCVVGNNCILANSTMLAGHVIVDDYATIGGNTAVQQFVRVGSYSYIGGCSAVDRNVPPYCAGYGNRLNIKGINKIGLMRRGFSEEQIHEIHDAWRIFYKSTLTKEQAIVELEKVAIGKPHVEDFLNFLKADLKGAIAR